MNGPPPFHKRDPFKSTTNNQRLSGRHYYNHSRPGCQCRGVFAPQERGKIMTSDKMKQSVLKDEYRKLLASDVWPTSQKMVDYCIKNAARIVELEGGGLVAIEKPRMQKHFCFGYSLNGHDSDDFDRANKMAAYAEKSTDYFIKTNMKQIVDAIKNLHDDHVYIGVKYYTSPENSRIQNVVYLNYWDTPRQGLKPISDNDRRAMIEAWKIVGRDFRRKIDTYLKRYGLSKVQTWSYWQDE